VIDGNLFNTNSYGNIVLIGDNSVIYNNRIHFSGRDQQGNGIDILDCSGVVVRNNVLFTSTCRGIYVVSSNDVVIDGNSITGGITYGIILLDQDALMNNNFVDKKDDYAVSFVKKLGKILPESSSNISVTNNVLSQNRYGLTATGIDGLTVTGNYFSQRFDTAADRLFWTNNAILLQNVTNLEWSNNTYKEAFTQINGGDNSMTQFVPFPSTGGVVI
jgi:parallel beta-helix repeat protein